MNPAVIRSTVALTLALGLGAAAAGDDLVVLHITGAGSRADYILEGQSVEEPVHVKVGQTVRWANDRGTTAPHTATSSMTDADGVPIFDTGRIDRGEEADVLMDSGLFKAAGGTAGGSINLEYFCDIHGNANMKSSLVLEDVATAASPSAKGTAALAGTPLIRKSIARLSAAEIDSLRRGVARMKARPAASKTSWRYWANIHWTTDPPTDPLWNQCEHGTIHFFTWHRAYLMTFEQVLRDAAGDPSLTLPYWDWTNNRTVPLPYRVPDDPSLNSLYDDRQMNDGSAMPTIIVVADLNTALRERRFSRFTADIDNSPHGTVHTLVGGPGGPMSSIQTSANDPIFWAHHANVDRIWNRWLDLGGGRTNPTDPSFLNTTFTFVGPDEAAKTIRVADVLDQTRLPYRYDDDGPATPSPTALAMPESPPPHEKRVGAHPLGMRPEVVRVQLPTRIQELLQPQAVPLQTPTRIMIDVVGIEFKQAPTYVYGVYLNLPKNESNPERLEQHYVGSISFFKNGGQGGHAGTVAHGESAAGKTRFTASLDATEAFNRLRAAGLDVGAQATVTLRPITLVAPAGGQAPAAQAMERDAQAAEVSYESIEVRVASD